MPDQKQDYWGGRRATPDELKEIELLFEGWYPEYIRVWDNYCSDGPGYRGWVAAFVGGEPELGGILTKDPDGKIESVLQGGS